MQETSVVASTSIVRGRIKSKGHKKDLILLASDLETDTADYFAVADLRTDPDLVDKTTTDSSFGDFPSFTADSLTADSEVD